MMHSVRTSCSQTFLKCRLSHMLAARPLLQLVRILTIHPCSHARSQQQRLVPAISCMKLLGVRWELPLLSHGRIHWSSVPLLLTAGFGLQRVANRHAKPMQTSVNLCCVPYVQQHDIYSWPYVQTHKDF